MANLFPLFESFPVADILRDVALSAGANHRLAMNHVCTRGECAHFREKDCFVRPPLPVTAA